MTNKLSSFKETQLTLYRNKVFGRLLKRSKYLSEVGYKSHL